LYEFQKEKKGRESPKYLEVHFRTLQTYLGIYPYSLTCRSLSWQVGKTKKRPTTIINQNKGEFEMKTIRLFLYFAAIIVGIWIFSNAFVLIQGIISDGGSVSWWITIFALMFTGLCYIIYVPINFFEERRKEKEEDIEEDIEEE